MATTLTVNGLAVTVPDGASVLEAALAATEGWARVEPGRERQATS